MLRQAGRESFESFADRRGARTDHELRIDRRESGRRRTSLEMEMRDAARVTGIADVTEQRPLPDDLTDVQIGRVPIEVRIEEEHRAFARDEDDLAAARLFFDARDDAPSDGPNRRPSAREEIGALMRAVKEGPTRMEIPRDRGMRDAVDRRGATRRSGQPPRRRTG